MGEAAHPDTLRIYGDTSKRGEHVGVGYCIKTRRDGEVAVIERGGRPLDADVTSLVGEYEALLYGVEQAMKHDPKYVTLHSDNRSVVQAVRSEWTTPPHVEYVEKIHERVSDFEEWRIFLVLRSENRIAHEQSRRACPIDAQD